MQQISLEEGIDRALKSIISERLAILCGAGLSMAPPSNLPSAAALARRAKEQYDATYAGIDEMPEGIEEQAEHFYGRGELATVYLRTYIDGHAFAAPPNPGHEAVADLLLTGGILTAVSTNVDCMIETAGHGLYGQVSVGYDQNSVARLAPRVSPLLKIHGCWTRDQENTVWAPSQLHDEPLASRVASGAEWLRHRLLDRDLLIVGYFTDWTYLNAVLEQSLGHVRPSSVVVVDMGDDAWLAKKAPGLYELGEIAGSGFFHVQASASDFLDGLRNRFSATFLRRLLHSGIDAFKDASGSKPDPAWLQPPRADSSTLWAMRRDLQGCTPGAPATWLNPANEPVIGLTLLQLRARGAQPDGPHWLIDGQRVRVLRAAGQMLHSVEAQFQRDNPPVIAPNLTIAVGAEPSPLPANVLRDDASGSPGSIMRSGGTRWLTRQQAVEELGL